MDVDSRNIQTSSSRTVWSQVAWVSLDHMGREPHLLQGPGLGNGLYLAPWFTVLSYLILTNPDVAELKAHSFELLQHVIHDELGLSSAPSCDFAYISSWADRIRFHLRQVMKGEVLLGLDYGVFGPGAPHDPHYPPLSMARYHETSGSSCS